MKKLLFAVVVFLLALPVVAQGNAVKEFIVEAGDAAEYYEFTVTLRADTYVNHSNWILLVESSNPAGCFKALYNGASRYNSTTEEVIKGISSAGVLKIEPTCTIVFSLANEADEVDPVRNSNKVRIAKVKKQKTADLTYEWQLVRFGKGKYIHLPKDGYEVNKTMPGYEACLGDSSTQEHYEDSIVVYPVYLHMKQRVDCYLRTEYQALKEQIQFYKW